MSCFDDSFGECLSPEHWQPLQTTLARLRSDLAYPQTGGAPSRSEVVAVLEGAGATNSTVLWQALTSRFQLVKRHAL